MIFFIIQALESIRIRYTSCNNLSKRVRLGMLWSLILKVGYKNNSCIREIQENSIESSLQTSLPYILLQMVRASYCASYPKWPCVEHKANMWYPCCMMSFCSKTFYFLLLSPVINVVTTPSDVIDYF